MGGKSVCPQELGTDYEEKQISLAPSLSLYLSSVFNGFHCREASGERVQHRGQGPDFLPQMCDPRQIYQNLRVSVYSGVWRVSTDPPAKCKCLSLPY